MQTDKNQVTAESTASRTIIGALPLIENAHLLKVTTINRRVAEQIKQGNIRSDDTLEGVEIVGELDSYKIVVRNDGHLYWFHQTDYVDWLVRCHKVRLVDAWDQTRKIPQLFAA